MTKILKIALLSTLMMGLTQADDMYAKHITSLPDLQMADNNLTLRKGVTC